MGSSVREMIITGIYLWWPRNTRSLAGVAYPRLDGRGRPFWRDLHAVTGLWVAFFTLFLLISGLPWAKSWGGMLKELRSVGANATVRQDWPTGRSSEIADRQAMNTQVFSEHAGRHGNGRPEGLPAIAPDYSAIDRLIGTVQPLYLAPPVLISPPSNFSPNWTARSDAQNRPLRVNLVLDGASGAILQRKDFAQRPLLDRIIGIGVAAHEGQLFGWPNQALGVFTGLGLVLVSASSAVLWWKRRLSGTLGAPKALQDTRLSTPLIILIVIIGILLPLLGISMLLILFAERHLLRRIPAARHFLGLRDAA